jgi:hypothetical protein
LDQAAELGAQEPSDLSHEAWFWTKPSVNRVWKSSVLPSALGETLSKLGAVPFVARAGNGIVYYQGGPPPAAPALPSYLFQRVKDAFDPKRLFPELTE